MPKFAVTHDSHYVFDITRVTSGNFKNLWRLAVSTPEVPELTEIVDADSLSTVLGKVQMVFEADGL